MDRGGDALERLEPRTARPPDPLIELGTCEPLVLAVEDADERVLQQVGPVQPLVLALQRGEPKRVEHREVPEALEQRPACALEFLALLGGVRGADFITADFVDSILREPLDMEAV